jgi:tRNA A37 threonylcarbamoyladenosine modification protein TsaB
MTGGRFAVAVQDGALALESGWDPIQYLSLEGVEKLVGREILQAAAERQAERDQNYWKNLQASTQIGVVKAFGGGS